MENDAQTFSSPQLLPSPHQEWIKPDLQQQNLYKGLITMISFIKS